MKSRRVTIRTGIVAKDYLSNEGLREIIEGIGNKMRKGKYYSALIQILKEIEYYIKCRNNGIKILIRIIIITGIFTIIFFFYF